MKRAVSCGGHWQPPPARKRRRRLSTPAAAPTAPTPPPTAGPRRGCWRAPRHGHLQGGLRQRPGIGLLHLGCGAIRPGRRQHAGIGAVTEMQPRRLEHTHRHRPLPARPRQPPRAGCARSGHLRPAVRRRLPADGWRQCDAMRNGYSTRPEGAYRAAHSTHQRCESSPVVAQRGCAARRGRLVRIPGPGGVSVMLLETGTPPGPRGGR